ncbi:sporulation protein [Bacillus lacus]|uniref:Sporulation protein n=1 Tax=Metabacillus lacus TaxID=1983721 RepID=A0A7X2LZZ8_9BACI|nr:CAP domain-containing protein [Metabacillus lacus]MRX72244.1 sporulation protein [Metabacillus lacus]
MFKKATVLSLAAAATIFTFNSGQANAQEVQSFKIEVKQLDQSSIENLLKQHFPNLKFNFQQAPAPKPVEQAKPAPASAPKPAEQAKPAPAPAPKPAEQAKPAPAPAPKPAEQAKPAPAPAPKPAEQTKPAPAPAPKPAEQTQSSVSAFEKKVVELTNVERQKQGLKPLQLDEALSKVARVKSQDMKNKNYFSHTSPTYGSPFDMMKQFGISYKTAGENIAMGQRSPEEVVKAWMNSEGHRKNIMNGQYTHIGVGHVADGNYWTQMFIGK